MRRHTTTLFIVAAIVAMAAAVAHFQPWTPASDLGYGIGVTGGSMMLILLLYPLRKRVRFMARAGPLRHWFRAHMFLGVCGPLLVLFHSAFHVGSANALVALSCMLLVASSGLVGRFIYGRIHHGLYGARTTAQDVKAALLAQLADMKQTLAAMPQVKDEIERFAGYAAQPPSGAIARMLHFCTLGWRRAASFERLVRAFDASEPASAVARASLVAHADDALRAMQRAAQFRAYERLFSLWHILHVPFVVILAITALVHVLAVHMY